MSDKAKASKEVIQSMSLVPYTDIRDVSLVGIEAEAPEEVFEDLGVRFEIGESAFRTKESLLQIKISAKVTYWSNPGFLESAEIDGNLEDSSEQIGKIALTYLVELELDSAVNPEDLDIQIINEFIDSNLLFMVYPYIRAGIQRTASEMPLPPTVLPYLRR